ncbi:gluconeogenesis factor YvcK family protein [Symbiobacterium thermophilum]|uniref:Putative gluconeogenesis factor n=3 Tax=Symbiobacterium thermophilum TaxID=2734 RepID=Q67T21_SYMTH|nr:YvcK family protein [Symbiobacterium thermophilum]MBY6276570.1 YvcK family protein [Symbiobacterium thermophilum]BAD39172.1 conserved hypothetical protein [Symbiobacterium thermophilum IAM 14863]
MRILRWFAPGLHIKRWLLVAVLGVALVVVGLSLTLRINLYRLLGAWLVENVAASRAVFYTGPVVAGVAALALGLVLTWVGISRLVNSVLSTLTAREEDVADAFLERRLLVRGPRVVAVGGGTGLPATLRGMKNYTANISAVVTVADDGGSSGRLRTEFGILPPGDIRNCLIALADIEPLMERLFQYRFTNGEGLAGHPFGNLFILAMSETTGDFYQAVKAASEVLAVRGRVLPSTLDHVVLRAELADGRMVSGESAIGRAGSPIRRVFLDPADPGGKIAALDDVLSAIAEAELIVLGPGSLYTSIMPNLLVPGVADAIRRSPALKIYVCNIMTEPGETDGFKVSDHMKALIDHGGFGLFDVCLVNTRQVPARLRERYREEGAEPVVLDPAAQRMGVQVVARDLLRIEGDYVRHDPEKLAQAIGHVFLARRPHVGRTPWEFFLFRQRLRERSRQEGVG